MTHQQKRGIFKKNKNFFSKIAFAKTTEKRLAMNDKLEAYKGLISFLGKALPGEFDAILFDLTAKGYPAREKSDWGRRNEREVRRLLQDVIREGAVSDEGTFGRVIPTSDQKLEKVSFYFIKEGGKTIGAIALNMELDTYLKFSSFLSDRLDIVGNDGVTPINMINEMKRERVLTDLDEIEDMVNEFCPDPSELTPTERKELFMDIYDTGIFRIKGAIPKAAEAMGISEQTIYRYISEIKKARR